MPFSAPRPRTPLLSRLLAALCLALSLLHFAPRAQAQAYASVVVFGDSLSDTGNDAAQSRAKYTFSAQVPGPLTGYTDGRFTDGSDTVPAARNYTGVWIEQLAARLSAKPAVRASLAGGTNYAYGFATTNNGTGTFNYGPGNSLNFTISNMGQQVSDYLSTSPTINSSTLYVVWGGANDLLAATSASDIQAAATRELALVQRLVAAGATDILVPNLPPLGLIPRLNGSATASATATAGAQAFNAVLAGGLAQLQAASAGRTLRLYSLDIFTLFNTAVAAPSASGFANVRSSSQGNTAINPDTYLFWDDLHPTTYGHNLIAAAALRTLGTSSATTTALSASATSANLGSSLTLTATVTSTSGTPQGTVTFLDGTTAIGSGVVTGTGSGTAAAAALTTTALAAGSHTLTAVFTGVNGFSSSTATATTTVTVIPPSYSAALGTSSLTVARGTSGTTTLTITPAGGYTGNFTITCGTVARVACFVASSTVSITTSASTSTFLTVDTKNTASTLQMPLQGGFSRVVAACLLLPIVAGLSLARRRKALSRAGLLAAVFLLSGGLLGIVGCGDSHGRDTPTGTYTVPVIVTPASGTATTLNLAVTVQ